MSTDDRLASLADLTTRKPRPTAADLSELWGVSRQRAHIILQDLKASGAVVDRGLEVHLDKTENVRFPIDQPPSPPHPARYGILPTLLLTEYPGADLTGSIEDGRISVSRTITASLPQSAGSLGTVVHRLARALMAITEPRP